jgi:tRNA uridine 5-carboxymethylaminomethyl modification enzyme
LTPRGIAWGCVGAERAREFTAKARALEEARALVRSLAMTPAALRAQGIAVNADGIARNAADLLAYPGVDLQRLAAIWPVLAAIPPEIAEQIEIDGKYAGYIERQEAEIRAFRREEALRLPRDLDYAAIGSLSTEVRGKLSAARPETLGAAGRVSGVTPAALIALLRHVRRREPAEA